jgi:hypothetical protein
MPMFEKNDAKNYIAYANNAPSNTLTFKLYEPPVYLLSQ